MQSSTEQSNAMFEAVYLFRDEDENWYVSTTPGKKVGWLWNPSQNKTPAPPTIGWRYIDSRLWISDDTLSVSPGTLPPLPRHFLVTVSGAAAEYQGVFSRTERWWYGRPVYVNTVGMFLYHSARDWGWVIGGPLGYNKLRGSRAHHSPVSEDSWKYYTGPGSGYKPASVTVTGSD